MTQAYIHTSVISFVTEDNLKDFCVLRYMGCLNNGYIKSAITWIDLKQTEFDEFDKTYDSSSWRLKTTKVLSNGKEYSMKKMLVLEYTLTMVNKTYKRMEFSGNFFWSHKDLIELLTTSTEDVKSTEYHTEKIALVTSACLQFVVSSEEEGTVYEVMEFLDFLAQLRREFKGVTIPQKVQIVFVVVHGDNMNDDTVFASSEEIKDALCLGTYDFYRKDVEQIVAVIGHYNFIEMDIVRYLHQKIYETKEFYEEKRYPVGTKIADSDFFNIVVE